jgi:hypothetical protein
MSCPKLRNLAGRAGYTILMAFRAGCGIENRAQSGTWIMPSFKLCLIESERVAGRLGYAVARTL